MGVVSTSSKESIREFNKKNHYKDWQFIYDPGTDRGGLLNTPNQPPLQGATTPAVQQNGPGGFGTSMQGPGMGGMQGGGLQAQPAPQPPPPQPMQTPQQ